MIFETRKAKLLANRLRNVIYSVISETRNLKKELLLFEVNFEKAYKSVDLKAKKLSSSLNGGGRQKNINFVFGYHSWWLNPLIFMSIG